MKLKRKTKEGEKDIKFHIQHPISNCYGITLIALIITIIILLILAVVTINAVQGDGIIGYAQRAKNAWEEASENEQQQLLKIEADIAGGPWKQEEGKITNILTKQTLNIGDSISYIPSSTQSTYSSEKLGKAYTGSESNTDITQDSSLQWKVLGVDGGCLTIISEKPTSTNIYLEGEKGYNNGVYILNDICEKLYSNSNLGKARSITIEDIEQGFNDEGKKARDEYTGGKNGNDENTATQYNHTKTYSSEKNPDGEQYPVIYAKENGSGIGVGETDAETKIKKDGIDESEPYYNEEQLKNKPEGNETNTTKDSLTCTETYYSLKANKSQFDNSELYNLFFDTSSNYWLASRCVLCYYNCAHFGMRSVDKNSLRGKSLFLSRGETYEEESSTTNYALRPVVTLNSDVELTKATNDGTTAWNIKQ